MSELYVAYLTFLGWNVIYQLPKRIFLGHGIKFCAMSMHIIIVVIGSNLGRSHEIFDMICTGKVSCISKLELFEVNKIVKKLDYLDNSPMELCSSFNIFRSSNTSVLVSPLNGKHVLNNFWDKDLRQMMF